MFGDDIGWFNISAYNHGLMGYKSSGPGFRIATDAGKAVIVSGN